MAHPKFENSRRASSLSVVRAYPPQAALSAAGRQKGWEILASRTVYIFSGSKVIAEYDNGAAPTAPSREYIYSGGALLAKIDSSGTKYYHQDHLSNRLVTDSSHNTVAQLGHFPFGESWYNASNDKLLFTSYERDSESGSDYARARYYASRLGRFSSPDPLAGSTGDPQSLNLYDYAEDDPADFSDPSGLCPEWGPFGVHGRVICTSAHGHSQREIIDFFLGYGSYYLAGCGENGCNWIQTSILIPVYGPPYPDYFPGGPGGKSGDRGDGGNSVNQKVLGDCINDLFGVRLDRFSETQVGKDGLFVGYGPDVIRNGGNNSSIYVKNYVGFSSDQLYTLYKQINPNYTPLPRGAMAGLTLDSYPYVNYTAYDAISPVAQVQVHELGNSLHFITQAAFNPDTIPESDKDAGQLLENCVRKRGGFK